MNSCMGAVWPPTLMGADRGWAGREEGTGPLGSEGTNLWPGWLEGETAGGWGTDWGPDRAIWPPQYAS